MFIRQLYRGGWWWRGALLVHPLLPPSNSHQDWTVAAAVVEGGQGGEWRGRVEITDGGDSGLL